MRMCTLLFFFSLHPPTPHVSSLFDNYFFVSPSQMTRGGLHRLLIVPFWRGPAGWATMQFLGFIIWTSLHPDIRSKGCAPGPRSFGAEASLHFTSHQSDSVREVSRAHHLVSLTKMEVSVNPVTNIGAFYHPKPATRKEKDRVKIATMTLRNAKITWLFKNVRFHQF